MIVPVEAFIRDDCCWKSCKELSTIILLGFGLCDKHFSMYVHEYDSSSLDTLVKCLSPKIKQLVKKYSKEEE